MKKVINAMSDISHEYIDELKNIGVKTVIRRRSYRAILIAATLSVFAVVVSLFVIIGSQTEPHNLPYIDTLTLSDTESSEHGDSSMNNTSDTSQNDDSSASDDSSIPDDSSVPDDTSTPDDSSIPDDTPTLPPLNYDESGASFTAQQMADILNLPSEGVATNQYSILTYGSIDNIKTGSLPQGSLPILIESDWEYDYIKGTLGGKPEYALYIGDKTIVIPKDTTHEEFYAIAEEFLPICQKYFGFDYSDIIVSGNYGIYYYDASKAVPYFEDGSFIEYMNSFCCLRVASNFMDSEYITLRYIAYKSENNSLTEGDFYETISLSEAEELLKNGYVFGGHGCALCMQQQPEIDFSSYDLAGIEYVSGMDKEGNRLKEHYPFYAFYKDIGEGRFARTYVPAFRVSGLEEYFESQKDNHSIMGYIAENAD